MEHPTVSEHEWLAARTALLACDKQMTRLRDEVSAERRRLPWLRVDKHYVFDAPAGPVTLADLFVGRSQLIVKHFMMKYRPDKARDEFPPLPSPLPHGGEGTRSTAGVLFLHPRPRGGEGRGEGVKPDPLHQPIHIKNRQQYRQHDH